MMMERAWFIEENANEVCDIVPNSISPAKYLSISPCKAGNSFNNLRIWQSVLTRYDGHGISKTSLDDASAGNKWKKHKKGDRDAAGVVEWMPEKKRACFSPWCSQKGWNKDGLHQLKANDGHDKRQLKQCTYFYVWCKGCRIILNAWDIVH